MGIGELVWAAMLEGAEEEAVSEGVESDVNLRRLATRGRKFMV